MHINFFITWVVGIYLVLSGIIVGLILLVLKVTEDKKSTNASSNASNPKSNDDFDYQDRSANQVKYCAHCGQSVEAHQVVCLNCGAQIKRTNSATEFSSRQLAGGLFGIFLGAFGVHNFYLGYTEKAVIQLLLGTVGALLIVGPMISGIWGLIEGIMILTGHIDKDGQGQPI